VPGGQESAVADPATRGRGPGDPGQPDRRPGGRLPGQGDVGALWLQQRRPHRRLPSSSPPAINPPERPTVLCIDDDPLVLYLYIPIILITVWDHPSVATTGRAAGAHLTRASPPTPRRFWPPFSRCYRTGVTRPGVIMGQIGESPVSSPSAPPMRSGGCGSLPLRSALRRPR